MTIREYVKKTLQVPLHRFSTVVQDAMLEIIIEAIEELHLNISLLPSILTPSKSRLDILDVIAESYGYSIDPDADIIEQFNIISHLAYINKIRGSIYSIENMHEFYGGSKPEYVKVEIPSYKIFRYSVSQYSVDHVYQDNRQHRTGVYNLYLRDQNIDLAELQDFMYRELVASGSRIFFMNNITQSQKYQTLTVPALNWNLYDRTQGFSGDTWTDMNLWESDTNYKDYAVRKRTGQWKGLGQMITLKANTQYTLSAWLKQSAGGSVRYYDTKATGSSQSDQSGHPVDVGTDWTRCSVTFTISSADTYCPRFEQFVAGQTLWVAGLKLEESPQPSSWSPSKSDISMSGDSSTPVVTALLTDSTLNLYCCVTDTYGNTVSKLVDKRDYISRGNSSQCYYLYIDLYKDSSIESSMTIQITSETEDVHIEILEDHTSRWVPFQGTILPLNCNVAVYVKNTSGTTITHLGRTLSEGWKVRSLLSSHDRETSIQLNTMYESFASPVVVPVVEGKTIRDVVTSPVGGSFYEYGETIYFYDAESTTPGFFDVTAGVSWLPHWVDFESPDLRYLPLQIIPESLITETNQPLSLTVDTPCLYVRTHLRGNDIPLDSVESIEYRVSQSSGDIVLGAVPALLTIPATCTKIKKRDEYSTEILEHVIKFSD